MRLWSLHPKYLDLKGLVAVWREGLLAKKVLENKTRGYKNHPQLLRFKNFKNPLLAINSYLYYIYEEAEKRGYHFNGDKIKIEKPLSRIILVSKGQIDYEFQLLNKKVFKRDRQHYRRLKNQGKKIIAHPLFRITSGGIEKWEKVK